MAPAPSSEPTTNRTSSVVAGAAILLSASAPATPALSEPVSLDSAASEAVASPSPEQSQQLQVEFPAYFRPAVAVISLATTTRQALKKFINDTSLPQTHMGLLRKNESHAIKVEPFLKVLNRVTNRLEVIFEQGATPESESLGIRSVAVHLQANLEVFAAHIRQLSEDGRLAYSERDRVCQSAIQLKAAVAQMVLKVEAIMSGAGDIELENEASSADTNEDSEAAA